MHTSDNLSNLRYVLRTYHIGFWISLFLTNTDNLLLVVVCDELLDSSGLAGLVQDANSPETWYSGHKSEVAKGGCGPESHVITLRDILNIFWVLLKLVRLDNCANNLRRT